MKLKKINKQFYKPFYNRWFFFLNFIMLKEGNDFLLLE